MNPILKLLTTLLLAPLAALHAAEPVTIDLSQAHLAGHSRTRTHGQGPRVCLVVHRRAERAGAGEHGRAFAQRRWRQDLLRAAGDGFAAERWHALLRPVPVDRSEGAALVSLQPQRQGQHPARTSMRASARSPMPRRRCGVRSFASASTVPFSFRMNKPTVLSTGEWIMPVTQALESVGGLGRLRSEASFRAWASPPMKAKRGNCMARSRRRSGPGKHDRGAARTAGSGC